MQCVKKMGLLALVLVGSMAMAWTPEPPFDVRKILHEASDDARMGRLDDAAAKHRWYHANALTYRPSHSGVRVSFAMSDWYALARRHAPAMQDMLAAQAKAVQAVRAGGPDAHDALRDLAAFAGHLADPQPIASTFAWLDANRPADARRFALEAMPALVTADAAALAVRYLDTREWLRRNESLFKTLTSNSPPGESKAEQRERAQNFVDRSTAYAVAALVKAGRPAEAAAMVDQLKTVVGADAKLHSVGDALRGHAPPLRLY